MQLRVTKLPKEEVYRGWVRIPERWRKDSKGQDIAEASVIQLTHGQRKLLATVRGDTESDGPTLKIDDISRKRLGIEDQLGRELEFTLQKVCLFAEFRFYWTNPEPGTRFAMRMAILSVVIGLASVLATLVTGFVSLCRK